MPSPLPPLKSHRDQPRPPFEQIVLLLQGGGALGAYQAGVYEALAEAGLEPDWVAGISIGAINSAIIAGNPPAERVAKLRAFWEAVTAHPLGSWGEAFSAWPAGNDMMRAMMARLNAGFAMTGGAPDFFTPRVPPPWLAPSGSVEASSYYDTTPLHATLERLVDFERINRDEMRMTIAAVNVRSGNFVLFDTRTHDIRPQHVMASGALPPGFPPVEIEGEHYWDGGLVSNTPLQWVLESEPQHDTLAFQVDLWNARGDLPRTIMEVATRQKDIQYSSRTRANTDRFRQLQRMRCALHAAGEAAGQAEAECRGEDAGRCRQPEGLQHRAPDLPRAAARSRFKGLRVLAQQHGGALAERLSGYGAHAAPSRSAAAPADA